MSQPRDSEFWDLVCKGNLEDLQHLLDRVLREDRRRLFNKKFGQFKVNLFISSLIKVGISYTLN